MMKVLKQVCYYPKHTLFNITHYLSIVTRIRKDPYPKRKRYVNSEEGMFKNWAPGSGMYQCTFYSFNIVQVIFGLKEVSQAHKSHVKHHLANQPIGLDQVQVSTRTLN